MASQEPITAVVFDLDGTLVQTRLASWEVFRPVSDAFGLGIREPEDFFALFDGNFYASLRELCRDEQQSEQVKQAFIASLGSDYRPWAVPGIAAVVRRLASVATLAVMSSNATPVIRRILSEHDLAFCISHVFGGDVIESKESAIRQFVTDPTFGPGRRCEGSYDESATPVAHEPRRTVLVTDTVGDVREARAAGIRAVGVTWGMHSASDLLEAGAEFVALWPQEILSHLLGDEAARPAQGACALPTGSPASGLPTAPAAAQVDRPGTGFAPCSCTGGHWKRTSSSRGGGCSCAGAAACGGAGACAPPRASGPSSAARAATEVRSRRSAARGSEFSAESRPTTARRPPGATRTRGTVTARELEAAVTLICAAT